MAPISTKITLPQLLTVAFIFSLTVLPPKSVGFDQVLHDQERSSSSSSSSSSPSISDDHQDYDEVFTTISRKMVLGSRPPGCVNKCLNCRPCTATLVIPSHQKKRFDGDHYHQTPLSHDQEHDSYYLLSWKCRCGNKLFHP